MISAAFEQQGVIVVVEDHGWPADTFPVMGPRLKVLLDGKMLVIHPAEEQQVRLWLEGITKETKGRTLINPRFTLVAADDPPPWGEGPHAVTVNLVEYYDDGKPMPRFSSQIQSIPVLRRIVL